VTINAHLERMHSDPAYACSHHVEAARQFSERFDVYVAEDDGDPVWVMSRINGHLLRALVALLSWTNEGKEHG
jgi:hypothetical protein